MEKAPYVSLDFNLLNMYKEDTSGRIKSGITTF